MKTLADAFVEAAAVDGLPGPSRRGFQRAAVALLQHVEALEVLDLVVVEWETDPMSVACFDARIRTRARALVR